MPGTDKPSTLLCLRLSPAACPELKLVSSVMYLITWAPACSCSADMTRDPPPRQTGVTGQVTTRIPSVLDTSLSLEAVPSSARGFSPHLPVPSAAAFPFLPAFSLCYSVFAENLVFAPSLARSTLLLPPTSLHLGALLPLVQHTGKVSRDAFPCCSHIRQFSHPISVCRWVAVPPRDSAPPEQAAATFLPKSSTVVLRHRVHGQLFGQPASQPRVGLQGLDLEVQLQLMVSGKTGASSRSGWVPEADWPWKVLMLQVKFHGRNRLYLCSAKTLSYVCSWSRHC